MYKLKVKSNKTCSCGVGEKLYSPKGYENTKCQCFLCEECWVNVNTRCSKCNDDISSWMRKIMKMEECTLCLLSKKMIKAPCGHSFCGDCWNETGKRKPECPLCRRNLTKWMRRRDINIYSENMYDEENLPTMDLPGSDLSNMDLPVSILRLVNNMGGIIRVNIYEPDSTESIDSEDSVDTEGLESTDEKDSLSDTEEPSYSNYSLSEDTFHCGCGADINIVDVASHIKTLNHITWVSGLSEKR